MWDYLIAVPVVNEVLETTGYESLSEDEQAFQVGYEVGREDALENTPCTIVGRLPAQRAGYAFGYVGEINVHSAYKKWNRFGRVA